MAQSISTRSTKRAPEFSDFIPSAPDPLTYSLLFLRLQLNVEMYPLIHALGASVLFACASAQTPPGTSPATNNPLTVNYGSTEVTPGIQLERMGQFALPHISQYQHN